jgi:integrase
MSNTTYPTGVEKHGGSLRIWFNFRGQRVRENLGVPDTAKNRKVAGELRSSVCFAIKMGNFNYASQFPDSVNLKRFGLNSKEISVSELAGKWLDLKKLEISANTLRRYVSVVTNMVPKLGPAKMVSAISKEDVLFFRKEILTGPHNPRSRQSEIASGRKVPTVNHYMAIFSGMFRFAADNGYTSSNPFGSITALKKSKAEPDPLSKAEFERFVGACRTRQIANLWTVAFYTGVRHGELVSLAWEDVDLKAGTLTVRRNLTSLGDFTLPKTDAGTDRVIYLVAPAIEALRNQAELTRVSKQHLIEIKLREYDRKRTHRCTFIFSPKLNATGNNRGHHYAVGSLSAMWDSIMKKAGLKHRKAYQSRHTFACWLLTAGANPSFIASQLGHSSAQMVYTVYGSWMPENSIDQVEMLNQKLGRNAPLVPQDKLEIRKFI